MTARPLWRGRALALAGIVLVALNLRTGVASLSPLVEHIQRDVAISPLALGLLGSAPPVCFAVFGVITPALTRRVGLERLLVLAMAVLSVALCLRGAASSAVLLLAATVAVFAGVAVGNVVLPPLVKKYFPDRIGLVTTLYISAMAVGTFLPPLVAVPVADTVGWRIALAQWGMLAAVALVPWVALLVRARIGRADEVAAVSTGAPLRRLWASPMAWAIVVLFMTSSITAYTMFAWAPAMLVEVAGVPPQQAGALLSLFAMVGLPLSLFVPLLTARLKIVKTIVGIATGGLAVGYLGLIVAPAAAPWLWVFLLALSQATFPLSLVLVNLRTRSHEASVALSGFVQSIGYAVAAMYPIGIGALVQATGAWTVPLWVLLATAPLAAIAGVIASRQRAVEDDIRR
ncbi:MAG TPA: MFS transporter [Microbacterium sp.]|uniref:MFS transporter n=1 Tax=Microbacterium sp. TaxID=51671 RepID=UPI002C66F1A1|nr:MFS transporter [Microbacterium sp.]HWI32448.1 MFS transporter [Microbacterium sp.]